MITPFGLSPLGRPLLTLPAMRRAFPPRARTAADPENKKWMVQAELMHARWAGAYTHSFISSFFMV